MYSRFPFSFHFYSLSLQCLHAEASLESGADEDGDLYIGKSVILRFVLDTLESGSSYYPSRIKQQ